MNKNIFIKKSALEVLFIVFSVFFLPCNSLSCISQWKQLSLAANCDTFFISSFSELLHFIVQYLLQRKKLNAELLWQCQEIWQSSGLQRQNIFPWAKQKCAVKTASILSRSFYLSLCCSVSLSDTHVCTTIFVGPLHWLPFICTANPNLFPNPKLNKFMPNSNLNLISIHILPINLNLQTKM